MAETCSLWYPAKAVIGKPGKQEHSSPGAVRLSLQERQSTIGCSADPGLHSIREKPQNLQSGQDYTPSIYIIRVFIEVEEECRESE